MVGIASLLCLAAAAAAAAAAADFGECGGLVTGSRGFLIFDRAVLAEGTQCLWRIESPGAKEILLTFDSLNLSRRKKACKQMLTVYSGNDLSKIAVPGSDPERYQICRNKTKNAPPPPAMRVAGDSALVLMSALRRGRKRGFLLGYYGVEQAKTCQQPTTSGLGAAACDGDWTVIQSRSQGHILFNQTWAAYRAGFGDLRSDHWLGLDALNELCPPARPCHLRVDVTTQAQPYLSGLPRQPDGRYHSWYGRFAVAADVDLYRLTIGDFNTAASTGGNSLDSRYDGAAFSTVDRDNDPWAGVHCSPRHGGGAGWWFIKCGYGLNGRWGANAGHGMLWPTVTGYERNAASARMLIRVAYAKNETDACATSPCDTNAQCTATDAGFACSCNSGYQGDGLTCTAKTCRQPTSSGLGEAACDGDWTVLQSRQANDVLFNQTWAAYSAGFGHTDSDHWLGLDALHELCNPGQPCQLRVELVYHGPCSHWTCVPRTSDGRYTAVYNTFGVTNATDLYRLTALGFNKTASTAGDSLSSYHNGMPFSTLDVDNDVKGDGYSCSITSGGGGGWWYYGCSISSLNGVWGRSGMTGLFWTSVNSGIKSAVSSRMLVRVAP